MHMKEIILDFSRIKTYRELHEHFKTVFDLPDYYGRNLDALWDCLRCSFEVDTRITLIGLDKMSNGLENLVDDIKELFLDLETEEREVTVEFVEGDTGDNSGYMI